MREPPPENDCIGPTVLDLVKNAAKSNSIREVLLALEPAMRLFELTNLRYYRYSPTRKTLTSQEAILKEGAETDDDLREFEEALRQGAVFAQETSVDDESESFWCFRLHRPVIFNLNQAVFKAMEPTIQKNGPIVINVRNHNCINSYFSKHKEKFRKWVDIPLYIANTPVGKLSLDLTEAGRKNCESEPRQLKDNLDYFYELCQYITPHLEYWISHEISSILNDAASKLKEIETTSELYEFCTQDLRTDQFFNCEDIDLFLIEKADSGVERLVLKASSNTSRKDEVLRSYYEIPTFSKMGERIEGDIHVGLTLWSALSQRGSRYSDLFDHELRARQERFYQSKFNGFTIIPSWENKIPLVNVVKSAMFIPIVVTNYVQQTGSKQDTNEKSELLGMLRFANKKRRDSDEFSAYDLRIGELLARYYIGPAVWNCKNNSYRDSVYSFISEATTVSGLGAPIESQPIKQLADRILKSKTESSRKLAICTIKQGTPSVCRADIVYSDSTECNNDETDVEFPIEGTIVKKAISLEDPLTFFADELSDDYTPKDIFVENAVVVVAVGISYGGKRLGALILSSTHFDLVYETDLAGVVRSLSNVFANSLKNTEQTGIGLLLSSLRHDFRNLIDSLVVSASTGLKDDQIAIGNLLSSLIDTICTHSYRSAARQYEKGMNLRPYILSVARVIDSLFDARVDTIGVHDNLICSIPEPVISTFIYVTLHNAMIYGERGSIGLRASIDDTTSESKLCIQVFNRCNCKAHVVNLRKASTVFLTGPETEDQLSNPSGLGIPRVSTMVRKIGGNFSVDCRDNLVTVTVTFDLKQRLL
jgi:hypothetical protein